MRAARLQDYRRRLREKRDKWKLRLDRFSFDGIPSLGTAEFPFPSPLTVVCGPNGVGKTTLLRAIKAAAFPMDHADDVIAVHKLPGGKATLDFHLDGVARSSGVTFVRGKPTGGTPVDVEVIHLEVALALPEQQKFICSFDDASELVNGIGSKTLTAGEAELLSLLTSRTYQQVKVYEVERDEQSVLPYFEVESDGGSYDSRTMGAGEFAISYLWWAISRATKDALVLIEEPECHLSSASQSAFCGYLLRSIVAKTLTVVMTTHSSRIISMLDSECLVFMYRSTKGAEFVNDKPSPSLLETVGIEPYVDTVVLVEDVAAAQFGAFLLQHFRPALARRTEFVDCGGESNITAAIKVAGAAVSVAVIGLYDGDVRNSVEAAAARRAAFLPGSEPMEKILRKMLEENSGKMAAALDKPDLEQVLFSLKSNEPHDWYSRLCRAFGQSPMQLYPILFRLWLRESGNEPLALETVSSLERLYTARR